MGDKTINFKELFLLLLMSLNLYSFEKVEFISEISYPKSVNYDNISIDTIGRIYLSIKGNKTIQIYNKFGSPIDTILLPKKSIFSKGGDFKIDKLGNIILVDSAKNFLMFSATISAPERGVCGSKRANSSPP